jgi:hypothetical protein
MKNSENRKRTRTHGPGSTSLRTLDFRGWARRFD